MKHLLIILFFVLISSFLTSCEKENGVLYLGKRNGVFGFSKGQFGGIEDGNNWDNSKYEGEIENDIPNGQGTLTGFEGWRYVGEWKNGEENGQGTMIYSNGRKYVGGWKDGLYDGKGIVTYPNGEIMLIGEFKEDELWNITEYDENGKIEHKYVNGEVVY